MMRRWAYVVVIVMGCGTAFAETGKAVIQGTAEGPNVAGTASFSPTPEGLKISVQVNHVAPGKHGLHIHQFGACQDAGKAAGGHFNPDGSKHGLVTKDGFTGAHAGDLGNIDVGADGTGSLDVTVPGLTLSGTKYSIGGRSVVLHSQPDDFGQPTGNAGGRVGCGPIVITGD